MAEKLVVDAEGKLTTPPHVLEKRGLHPGDELTLVEADDGSPVPARLRPAPCGVRAVARNYHEVPKPREHEMLYALRTRNAGIS